MTFKIKDGISVGGASFLDANRNISSNNITLTGEIRGPSTLVIDPATVGDETGLVQIRGNLQVDGVTTTINSTTLTVDDKNIVIADGASTLSGIDTAGIDFGTSAVKLRYNYNGNSNPGLGIEGTNVGIGTTAPLDKLDVVSASSTFINRVRNTGENQAAILFQNSTTGTSSADGLFVGIGGDAKGYLYQYETQPLVFGTDNTERARISSDGNFLIGITAATASYNRLTVAGTGISIADDGNAKLQIGRYSSGVPNSYIKLGPNSNSLRFTNAADSVDIMELTNAGNLGLGTTPSAFDSDFKAIQIGRAVFYPYLTSNMNLGYNIHYVSGDKYIADGFALLYQQNGLGVGEHSWLVAGNNTSGADAAATFSRAMVLSNSGNLGLGTTNPTNIGSDYKHIEINGTTSGVLSVSVNGTRTLTLAASGSDGLIESRVNGGALRFFTNGGSVTERARISSDGNVGIGTTAPAERLHIVGTGWDTNVVGSNLLRLEATGNVGAAIAMKNANGQYWNIYNGGSGSWVGQGNLGFVYSDGTNAPTGPTVTFTSGGNVGIGETNPTTTLDVSVAFPSAQIKATTGTNRVWIRTVNTGGDFYFGRENSAATAFGVTAYSSVLWSQGAYPMVFATDNAEKMRITSGGNVGIGTTNPGVKLDISGAVRTTAGTTNGYRLHTNSGITATDNYMNFYTTQASGWAFNNVDDGTFANTRVVITASGNVGIGTTSPLGKLHVEDGSVYIGDHSAYQSGTSNASSSSTNHVLRFDNSYNGRKIIMHDNGSNWLGGFGISDNDVDYFSGGNHRFYTDSSGSTDGTEKLTLLENGNVGIGATAPSFKLDVAGGDDTNSFRVYGNSTYGPSVRIQFTGTGGKAWNLISNATDNAGGLGALQFWNSTDSVTAMVIKPAGNIGIGTNDPARKLHIHAGSSGATADTSFSQTVIENSGDAGIHIINPNANIGRIMFGSPSRQYGALIRWEPTNNNFDFSTDKAGGYLRFLTDNFSERMRITSTGNVGIGTTSPLYQLDVVSSDTNVFQAIRSTSSSPTNVALRIQDATTGTSTSDGLYLGRASSINYLWTYENEPWVFATNNTERARITSGGNVGIGTTSPNATLEVNGNIQNSWGYYRLGTYYNNDYRMGIAHQVNDRILQIFSTSNDSNGHIVFSTRLGAGSSDTDYGTERMRITSTGRVGIGETNPSLPLHIANSNGYPNSSGTTEVGFLTLRNKSAGSTHGLWMGVANASPFGSWLQAADANNFATNYPLLLNPNGGNVGIGTTSPFAKLHVKATTNKSFIVQDAGIADTTEISNYDTGDGVRQLLFSASNLLFYTGTAGGGTASEKMRITTGGNVGIGFTNPAHRLAVSGKTYLDNGTSNALQIDTTVADLNTRDAIYLYESSGQATGRQAISWYNGNQNYYKARIWTEVGDSYVATRFGIDVASNDRTVATRLVINNGNIGIGTTAPETKLHVSGTHVSGRGTIEIDGDNFGLIAVRTPSNGDGSAGYWGIRAQGTSGTDLMFYGHRLVVGSYEGFVVDPGFTGSAALFVRKSDSNVGIGTTSPGAKLEVSMTRTSSTSGVVLQLSDNVTGLQTDGVYKAIRSVSNNGVSVSEIRFIETDGSNNNTALGFATQSTAGALTERMRITRDGTVGIGNTAAQSRLTVGANFASIDGITVDTGNVGDSAFVARKAASKPAFGLLPWDSQVYLSSGVYYDGYSWIHHSNSNYNQLFVMQPESGVIWYASSDGSGSWNEASNINLWNVNAHWKSTVQSTRTGNSYFTGGNVGIGTTSPFAKLHVKATTNKSLIVQDAGIADTIEISNYDTGDGVRQLLFSASNLLFYTGTAGGGSASEKMRVTTAGNVGIGVTDPGARLDITGSNSLSNGLRLRSGNNADSTSSNQILLGWNGSTSFAHAIKTRHHDGDFINSIDFFLWKYGTDASATPGTQHVMTLIQGSSGSNLNGAVGIGTTAPTAKFTVNNSGATTQAFYADIGNPNSPITLFEHTGNNTPVTFRLKKSGYSGAALNYGLLYLHMNDNTVGNGSALYFTLNSSAGTEREYAGIGAVIRSNTNGSEQGDLYFMTLDNGTSRSEKMRITSSGYLGIGTNGPAARIDAYEALGGTGWTRIISRDANKAAFIGVYRSGSTYSPGIFAHSSALNAWADLWINAHDDGSGGLGGATANKVVIAGNVGIGTASPQSQLQVGTKTTSTYGDVSTVFSAGVASASGGIARPATFCNTVAPANGNEVQITFTPASDYSATGAIGTLIETISNADSSMRFLTYSAGLTERMRITSGGNVGIGTTNPEGKLDIIGSPINGTQQADWSGAGISYNSYGDVTISRRHGASKDSTYGYTGPLIDFRASNTVNEWSVAQIMGTIDPQNGNNHQGGLVFLTSSGGNTDPTGRRTAGAAPQVRMLISHSGDIYMNGNLGIGVTAPSTKLDVNGTATATVFNTTSDRNRKENIQTIENALDMVNNLRGVRFTWKESKEKSIGVIAQEIEEIIPEVVQTSTTNGEKTVAYGNIVGVLIEAIKEQQSEINELKSLVKQLIENSKP